MPVQVPAIATPLPPLPVPDPSKKLAVVVSSAQGAEITDTLPNFEILADSGAFNVYSVAPERTLLPLVSQTLRPSGLDFFPHFSYAEYESQIGRDPDLIVIPGMPGYTRERDAAMIDWIRAHAGPNTTVLGICIGGIVLADTGLVNGHTTTTNAGVMPILAAQHPATTWVPNVRYFDDGNMVESTTLTSGIDSTLHIVDRFAGRATTLEVARQLGYTQTGALDDPGFDPPTGNLRFEMGLLTGLEVRQQLGVPLYEGVSEFGLAGLLDPEVGSTSASAGIGAPQCELTRSTS
ncbi:MAG: DJ-1/PfpI family protein [Chloroflexi bacterium]|nr:DJ-1/PfpI family protein [Chloroflexota bacterium]